jgi:isopenicillin N synthase-like dioxygenase
LSTDVMLPTLDLSTVSAAELVGELRRVSCIFVTGHGVDPKLQSDIRRVVREFFALSDEEKSLVAWPKAGFWRGWLPQGSTSDLPEEIPPNLVQWYKVNDLEHFSLWPKRPTDFREVATNYFHALEGLASRIVLKIAHGLDLPDEPLADWTTGQFGNIGINHYPALEKAPLPGQVRLTAHTDDNGFTILMANDAPGGLEVRIPGTGTWTPVHVPPDAYLVQTGDLLARWTNRYLRASVHRVVNPPLELLNDPSTVRDTISYFQTPNMSSWVVPAESCVAITGGIALEPLNTLEYVTKSQRAYIGDLPIQIDLEV